MQSCDFLHVDYAVGRRPAAEYVAETLVLIDTLRPNSRFVRSIQRSRASLTLIALACFFAFSVRAAAISGCIASSVSSAMRQASAHDGVDREWRVRLPSRFTYSHLAHRQSS